MLGVNAGEVMMAVQMAMIGELPCTALRDAIIAHPLIPEGLNILLNAVPARAPAPLNPSMETSMNEAHSDALLSWQSRHNFAGTLARLRDALADKGLRIFAEIDQAAAAADSGLAMPATVLILFGNPKAGTPVMLRHPLASVELPLRLVVQQEGLSI